jgi:diguanylate cyclase (GGDEF)-like protein
VVDLLTSSISQLPASTRQILELAACIGSQFDLHLLAGVEAGLAQKTANDLWDAVKTSLLIPLNDAYKLAMVSEPDSTSAQAIDYMFAHDRIRQAVYSLIPASKKRELHQRIGAYLHQNTPQEKRAEKIFDIANHFNLAGSETEQSNNYFLAEINLQAGRQAKKSAAFKPAFNYLRAGLSLLESHAWQERYALMLALVQESLETAYAGGLQNECDALMDAIFCHSRGLLDKVAAYQIKIKILVSENKPLQALDISLDILTLLGVELPRRPGQEDIILSLEKVQRSLADRPVEDLVNLPEMSDPNKLAAMQILTSSTVAAFNALPRLYSLISFERVSLSIQYGNTLMSPAAYASYGLYLCGAGDIEQGYSFGRLALNLIEKMNAPQFIARTWVTAYTFCIHWKEPLRNILEPLLKASISGLQTGDIEFSTGALVAHSHTAFFCGTELSRLREQYLTHINAIRPLMHHRNQQVVELHLQMALNLLEGSDYPDIIKGAIFDEDQALPALKQANDQFSIFHLLFYKALLGYQFYQFDRALENLEQARQYLDSVRAEYIFACFYFYHSLISLAIYPARSADEQQNILGQVAANQEKLKIWAGFIPANHLNKHTLVQAERARILKFGGEAREAYDQAISLARDNQFVQEEALACELAAKFYMDRGQVQLGYYYLLDAHKAYQQWNAQTKVKHLEEMYPQIFSHKASVQPWLKSMEITTTSKNSSDSLDFISLLKASQALSGEIVLKTLLEKLMRSILENAGAQKGFLILEKEGDWVIEAGGSSLEDLGESLDSLPLEADLPLLAASVVHYVIRTREALVFNDAVLESTFTRDDYISSHQVKSLLCMPLLNQFNLVGVLYLENNLVSGAFTIQRMEFLRLLSLQAAISIENARFYELLEQKVAARTRELQQEVDLRRQAEERANQLAIIDPLTELYNRRYFFAALENEIWRSRRYETSFAIIMLDIDYFKKVNDSYGHLTGDLVLKTLAERARDNFREVDTLARYGGEEFIFLLPETDIVCAMQAAERLRLNLEKVPFDTNAGPVWLTASLGVTAFNRISDSSPDILLERADQALYNAKNDGRNRICSTPGHVTGITIAP